MRMASADVVKNPLGPRMIGGGQQRGDDREALRRDSEAARAAAIGEFSHAPLRVRAALVGINQLHFHRRW